MKIRALIIGYSTSFSDNLGANGIAYLTLLQLYQIQGYTSVFESSTSLNTNQVYFDYLKSLDKASLDADYGI